MFALNDPSRVDHYSPENLMLNLNDKIVLFFCEMATALDSFFVQPRKRQYPGENSNCLGEL
jgi:hypothetical protein